MSPDLPFMYEDLIGLQDHVASECDHYFFYTACMGQLIVHIHEHEQDVTHAWA